MRKLQFIIFLSIVILLGCTDNIENEDYWAESGLCDSKNACIELGEQSGEEIFDILAGTFRYSNLDFFIGVGLETDEYADREGFSFDDFAIAEYENSGNTFVQNTGEEHPFFKSILETVRYLLFNNFVEVDSVQFLSEGYPYIDIFGDETKLGLPLPLEDFPSQNVVNMLLHELAHVLTMNDMKDTEACYEVNTIDNCFDSDSYMQQFSEKFWSDYPEKWLIMDYQSMNYDERNEFYKENKDHFVSLYASVAPQEDIAESFTHFMLSPYNDEPESLAEEKIYFFYQFNEFVEYRAHVLQYPEEVYMENGNFY